MFKDAKVGDRVWSYTNGNGVIIRIIGGDFPVCVKFNNGSQNFFTVDGKLYMSDLNQTLFWGKIEFEIPNKQLDIDTKVIVWDEKDKRKYKRYFKRFNNNGKIVCFSHGATSWSTNYGAQEWNYWKLAEENTEGEQ